MKLVKYDDNWADEMDIEGFTIVSDEAWEKFVSFVSPERFSNYTFYIGTNEEIEFDSVEDIFRALAAINISPEDAKAIKDNFNLPYGFFPVAGLLEKIVSDNDLEWDDWMAEFD